MTNAPVLKRLAYHAWIAPPGADPDDVDQLDYHHVLVINADQLMAEKQAPRWRLSLERTPHAIVNLWLWCALTRTGRYDRTFQEFQTDLITFQPDKDREHPHTEDPDDQELDDLDAHPTEASTS